MRGQPGFFDIDDRLKRLSDLGDQLETFRSAVDFELFRPELNAALSYTEPTEGGRPPFDPVLMFTRQPTIFPMKRAEFLMSQDLPSLAGPGGSRLLQICMPSLEP
jgi:transposase, IS5 family